MKIKIKRLSPHAVLPKYAHGPEEDAGMDLYSTTSMVLAPGSTKLVPIGLSIELPPGYQAEIRPRSGLALKHGITVLNTPGTIDPAYRGELGVILHNAGNAAFSVNVHDRIAQLVITRYEPVSWEEVTELSETKRGEGGFASTGISTSPVGARGPGIHAGEE